MKLTIKWLLGFAILFILNVPTFAQNAQQTLPIEFVNTPSAPVDAKGQSLVVLSIKNNVHDQSLTFTVTSTQNNTQYASLQVIPLENNANACENVNSSLNTFKIAKNATCNIGIFIEPQGLVSAQTLQDRLTLDYDGITFPYYDLKYNTGLAPVFESANGPDSGVIYSVVAQNNANKNTHTLYAGGAGGVFSSTDNGNTWSAFNHGFPVNTNVTALTISDDNIVYAATANSVFGGPNRIYKFINNAWSEIAPNTDPLFIGITSLWVSPENDLLAGSESGLFWWDGSSWTHVVNDLLISSIISNPAGGAYVGAWNFSATNENTGVFSWNNDTLTQISQTAGTSVLSLIYDSVNSTLYAGGYLTGVYALHNNSWQEIGSYADVTGLALDTNNNLYVASNFNGIYQYSSGTWTSINNGLPVFALRGFNGLISAANKLYVFYAFPWSGGFGVYQTALTNISWKSANNGLIQTNINALAIDSNNKVYASAGLSGPFQLSAGTWSDMFGVTNPDNPPLNPVDTGLMAVGDDENSLYIVNNEIVYQWDGNTWEKVIFNSTRPALSLITSMLIDGDDLYLGSINGLFHWNGNILTVIQHSEQHWVTSLEIDKSVSPHILYVGVTEFIQPEGIYTLTLNNELNDFTQVFEANIADLALLTTDTGPIVFASLRDMTGVWTLNGSTWTDIPSLSEFEISRLAVDSEGTLYSSGELSLLGETINAGIFITPYQQNAYFVTEDMYITGVSDIAIDSNDKVYAGTQGSGVYTLP